MTRLIALAVMALALSSPAVYAQSAAGEAIFVFGKAEVVAANGAVRVLEKGGALDEGDRIVTGASGRVQLRLADGGLIALRPASEFIIEAFHYEAAASGDPDDPFAQREDVSFFSLLKGGFRSLTGAVGKEDKKAYRVRTPVATIGIRGTDYDAVLCAGDCATLSRIVGSELNDGLYVGVNSGGVVLANDGGTLELDANEFGFAAGANQAPAFSEEARDALAPATQQQVNDESALESTASVDAPASEPAPDTGVQSQPVVDNQPAVDFNTGVATVEDTTGAVAFANVPDAGNGTTPAGSALQVRDGNGDVVQFNAGDTVYEIDTSQLTNVGRDDNRDGATGLTWGRWAGGTVTATGADGQARTLAVDSSVHFVAGAADTPTPQVPVTGTQSFQLIGNTDPTDSRGNVGTLGNATLDANFDAQTVDADVSLSFAQTNEVWDASAQDVDINAGSATFGGAFDQVTITTGQDAADGSGSLSGFFSGNDNAEITGAGFTYSLTDDAGTDVAGSAAFQ
ncbi:MAG: FecR family protein, partial [Pseudomonadota bacterium]